MSVDPEDEGTGQTRPSLPFDPARLLLGLVMALRFYSRLPVGENPHARPDLDQMAPVAPVASLIIGIGPVAVLVLGGLLGVPSLVAATIAVALLIVLTGGLSEDGLADSADGLLGGHTSERRLEIFRDVHHGTFAVSALVLFLVARVALVASFLGINAFAPAMIWLAAMILSRSGALWLAVALPPARPDGLSATAGRAGIAAFGIGMAAAAVLAYLASVWFTNWYAPIVVLLPMALVAYGWSWVCRRLVGGQTGDLIGALQALLEITALTALITLS